MKTQAIILLLALALVGCKQTSTEPTSEVNLITNSTFEANGVPSLNGWEFPDTSAVHFSIDIPPTGLGYSIVFGVRYFGIWPNNSIYTTITGLSGKHRYRLSVFGKGTPVAYGGVYVYRNRPSSTNSILFGSLEIRDTVWTFYSRIDTLNTTSSDTLFINVTGGAAELFPSTSIYFNTCKFERLD